MMRFAKKTVQSIYAEAGKQNAVVQKMTPAEIDALEKPLKQWTDDELRAKLAELQRTAMAA